MSETAQSQPEDESILKPRKSKNVRSPAQQKQFEKAREKRYQACRQKQDAIALIKSLPTKEVLGVKAAAAAAAPAPDQPPQAAEPPKKKTTTVIEESDSEPETIVIKKKKRKPRVIYLESDDDDEPSPKIEHKVVKRPQAAPQAAPPQPAAVRYSWI